jgi:hypothetical protein
MSSLRSAERLSHHETEAGGGWEGRADFVFDGSTLLLSLPGEGVTVLPLALPPDREAEEGVLRGMSSESIAQMVCFSFAVK